MLKIEAISGISQHLTTREKRYMYTIASCAVSTPRTDDDEGGFDEKRIYSYLHLFIQHEITATAPNMMTPNVHQSTPWNEKTEANINESTVKFRSWREL